MNHLHVWALVLDMAPLATEREKWRSSCR